MNKIIKEALVLMAITLVSGLLLGAVYSITKQPIAQAEEKAQKEAYLAVFPDAQDLTEPDNKEELLTEAADVLDQAGFGTADTLEDFYLAEKDGAVTGVVMNITSHGGYGVLSVRLRSCGPSRGSHQSQNLHRCCSIVRFNESFC